MREQRAKRSIAVRIFSVLLVTYLLFMCGFSMIFIEQRKKQAQLEFQAYAIQAGGRFDEFVRQFQDGDGKTDLVKLRKDMIGKTSYFNNLGTEAAFFTGDYELLFNTNTNWTVSYNEYTEGVKHYSRTGELNPRDWFSEQDIAEMEKYMHARPEVKKIGDLCAYVLNPASFWVDNGTVIPEIIEIIPLYATSINSRGKVAGSRSYAGQTEKIYTSSYSGSSTLPYFKYGTNQLASTGSVNTERQAELRNLVVDKERLKETLIRGVSFPANRVHGLTYRLFMVRPFQGSVQILDNDTNYSEFWMTAARDVDLWKESSRTFLYVWGGCLIIFAAVGTILFMQTYRTYKKQADLDRYRKETTDALAHDLKTPLSIISGYAENLLEHVHTNKREHYAASILTHVRRMDGIIRQMLDLSRIESKQLQVAIADLPLHEVCAQVLERYRQLCEDRAITVSLTGEADIKADRSLLDRVMDNFFVNALDNMQDGGRISITIDGSALEFYNSGSHIPEERMADIWQPYQMADASRSQSKGTGLGLSIARSILDSNQFKYGVRNESDGVVFWFTFDSRYYE